MQDMQNPATHPTLKQEPPTLKQRQDDLSSDLRDPNTPDCRRGATEMQNSAHTNWAHMKRAARADPNDLQSISGRDQKLNSWALDAYLF